MKQAELIKAINDKKPALKVSEDLLVVQLQAIYDGMKAQEEVVEVKQQLAILREEHEALTASYQELAEANQEAESSTIGGKTTHKVKIGKETYRTTGKAVAIRKQGDVVRLTAAELVKDKKLCEELVEQGSGFLVKVEPSKDAQ